MCRNYFGVTPESGNPDPVISAVPQADMKSTGN